MYRFSIVVPMLGSSSLFEATLASVLRYRPKSCQVIVVHAGSYDDPYELGAEVEFVAAPQASNLIGKFNRGLEIAKGEFVSLIQPGIEFQENWSEAISSAFSDENVGSVSPAIISSRQPSRLVAAGVTTNFKFTRKAVGAGKLLRSRRLSKLKPVAPTCWAAFYRRSLLNSLGECDAQLDSQYLDVDLGLSLRNLNFACKFCADCVVKIDDESSIAQSFRLPHGKSAQRALVRHRVMPTSHRLARTLTAAMLDLLSVPFSISYLKHALQRLGAIRMRKIDRLHMDLIQVLGKQRQRLVTSDLRTVDSNRQHKYQHPGHNRVRRAA